MTESLTIAGQIELLGGGVASTIPYCYGATFMLAPGYDLGAPQPASAAAAALVLDGERPVGRRVSNRVITLPIKITAPNRTTLAAAREYLLMAVNRDPWELKWSRDGTLPVIYDCFAADPVDMGYAMFEEQALIYRFEVKCQALPYCRSDTPTIIDFQAPLPGVAAPPAPVTLDDFTTVSGTNWTASTVGPTRPDGPSNAQTAHWHVAGSGVGSVAQYSHTGMAAADCSGRLAMTFWVGFGSSGYFPHWAKRHGGPVTFYLQLFDSHGAEVDFVKVLQARGTNDPTAPYWQQLRATVPQLGIDMSTITGYAIIARRRTDGDLPYTDLYLSNVQLVPCTTKAVQQPTAGAVYSIAGLVGTARAPIALQCQQPTELDPVVVHQKITGPAGSGTFVVPAGVTVIQKAALTGGGGRGGADWQNAPRGGGGAGAWQTEFGLRVTPGTSLPYYISPGGTPWSSGGQPASTMLTVAGITIEAKSGYNVVDLVQTGASGGATTAVAQKLTGDNSTFDASIGNWVPLESTGNCTLLRETTQRRNGAGALRMTSAAAGDMIAASCSAANIKTQGIGCWGKTDEGHAEAWWCQAQSYARYLTGGAGRAVSMAVQWFDKDGTSLGTSAYGSTVTDNNTGWSTVPAIGSAATATPNGGRWYRILIKVAACAAAGEQHAIDDVTAQSGAGRTGGAGGNSGSWAGAGGGAGSDGGNGQAGGGSPGNCYASEAPVGSGGQPARTAGHHGTEGNIAGGGGGGSWSRYSVNPGTVPGAQGMVELVYLQTPPYRTMLLHRPGPAAPDTLSPFVSVDVDDTPTGSTEYRVPSLIPGVYARFNSTYTIVLVANAWNTPANGRTLTVKVRHYEQAGGIVYDQTVSRTVTPNNLSSKLVTLGELTLPDHLMPDDNMNSYFTVTVTSTNTSDRFQDVLFLDTLGSTIMVECPQDYVSFFFDESSPDREIGDIMASVYDRQDAVSVLKYATVSGPPLTVDPDGCPYLLAYAAEGAPCLQMTYWPRWWMDRVS